MNELLLIYAPFVNSYEKIKNTILRLEKTNYRFSEFFLKYEARHFGKNRTLLDLISKPLQRLPNTILQLYGNIA